jgi:hypothetical protein
MKIDDVRDFQDLEQYLKDFSNFGSNPDYDFVGAFHLFVAILDNLTRNHLESELDNLADSSPCFTPQQYSFLSDLVRLAQRPGPTT